MEYFCHFLYFSNIFKTIYVHPTFIIHKSKYNIISYHNWLISDASLNPYNTFIAIKKKKNYKSSLYHKNNLQKLSIIKQILKNSPTAIKIAENKYASGEKKFRKDCTYRLKNNSSSFP